MTVYLKFGRQVDPAKGINGRFGEIRVVQISQLRRETALSCLTPSIRESAAPQTGWNIPLIG